MDHARKHQSVRASRISLSFLGSFLITIFLLRWWQLAGYPTVVWYGLGLLGLLSALGLLGLHARKRKTCAIILSCTIGIAAALFAVSRTTHVATADSIDSFAHGKTVTIEGAIADAPDDRQDFINYTVDVRTIQQASTGASIPVHGKVLATDRRRWPRFQYGDQVTVIGILDRPKASESFAYDNYLSRFNIYATQRATSIVSSSPSTPLRINSVENRVVEPIVGSLIKIRNRFESQINSVYPEPHASFLAGLLTGSRRGLPDHLAVAFKQTGLTHIVAISGFNITIIIAILGSLLFFLPLKKRFLPTVVAVILFTLFVGAGASVVRASIMGILGLLALQTGRLRDARLAILWTAFFMLAWNPKQLWYDASFQLSFLAVIGLTETAPHLEQWLKKVPQTLGLREALTMTIAAQVFAMPWVVLQFGTLSLISPLANILVAPLIPPAMLFGFLGTTISFVSFPLGQLIGYIGWGCMQLIIVITELLAAIPYASVNVPEVGIPFVCVYYTLVVCGLVALYHRKKSQLIM